MQTLIHGRIEVQGLHTLTQAEREKNSSAVEKVMKIRVLPKAEKIFSNGVLGGMKK